MKRLAIVCGGGLVSGKEIMVLELAEALRKEGLQVHVLTSKWGSRDFVQRLHSADIQTTQMWLGFIALPRDWNNFRMTADQLWHWPALVASYLACLRREKPDRVLHTNWHHALLLWPFLDPDRDYFWLHELPANKPQYRFVFRSLQKRLRAFIAVSQAVKHALRELSIPEREIQVIYNGIEEPRRETPAMRSPGKVAVGIVGQIGPWKGHEELIEAIAGVIAGGLPVELNIFGRGEVDYERTLRACAERLGIARQVTWRGFVADRAQIFSTIDILSVPSRFEEPFGLTAVEAAFFELPVVASRRGGLMEIVEDGVTGLLFESQNILELTDCLVRLVSDEKMRQEMGRNARKRAQMLFSRGEMKDRFMNELAVR